MTADRHVLSAMSTQNTLSTQIEKLVDCFETAKRVFITVIGKSGIVAQRMTRSLSSIGIDAQFVNGVDWIHDDIDKLKMTGKTDAPAIL